MVLSTSTPFLKKSLFLCFQEAGNGTNDARNPCKVHTSQLQIFLEKHGFTYTPKVAEVYISLGIIVSVSCQAV